MGTTARELAKDFIRPYVERGDGMAYLREGGMGYAGREGDLHIHLDHIFVERIGPYDGGTPCDATFRLADIYAEVKAECRSQVRQAALFADGQVSA